jgi:hypothetical protein
LAFGYDHWWHPSTGEEASGAAREVLALMETHGLPWMVRMTDPDAAIAALLPMQRVLWHLEAAAALLVERPSDQRRTDVLQALRRWDPVVEPSERALWQWLVANLA